MQNEFYNGYHHGDFIIWLGVLFPDGIIVIEGPEPGHFTLFNTTSQFIGHEMDIRVANGKRRLKLYAEKIYNVCPIVTPARSRQQGALHDWMTVENSIVFKIVFLKRSKNMNSPSEKHHIIACLLSNCHTCNYGDQHTKYFDVYAPSLDNYLS